MPFRARLKHALHRSHSSSNGDDLTQSTTNGSSRSKKPKKEKLPDNVYKPGEAMPRPKYRGPVNKAHQDQLSAFSFGDMWNRRHSSANDEISPGQSRAMSRRNSLWSRKGRMSRQNSGGFDGVKEGEGDDDIANVGLSRVHTAEPQRRPRPDSEMTGLESQKTLTDKRPSGLDTQSTITNGTNGQMFTEDDLARALTQSTLKASRPVGE